DQPQGRARARQGPRSGPHLRPDQRVCCDQRGLPKLTAALKRVQTSALDVAFEESGAADGAPVFLMHGWPYDPRCYDAVIAPLCAAGARVIVPYLRGFGPTRFLDQTTPRSGQQAALGNDLRELMDALTIDRAVLAGYDWGGRGACIVAALWPGRVRGL